MRADGRKSQDRRVDVFIGVGANLPGPDGAPPLETCRRALAALADALDATPRASSWFRSAPVPESAQPRFVNAVARFRAALPPREIMDLLLTVEARFGRRRGERWAARVLDLDLLDCGGAMIDEPGLTLPHPRLPGRAFVLLPLAEIAPDWRHPRNGRAISSLVAALPPGQTVSVISPPDERQRT